MFKKQENLVEVVEKEPVKCKIRVEGKKPPLIIRIKPEGLGDWRVETGFK